MFAQGADLQVLGREVTELEAYILKCRYMASEYKTYPWNWDPDYPEDKWCPEDFETILQCDIAHFNFQKLKKHPQNVS